MGEDGCCFNESPLMWRTARPFAPNTLAARKNPMATVTSSWLWRRCPPSMGKFIYGRLHFFSTDEKRVSSSSVLLPKNTIEGVCMVECPRLFRVVALFTRLYSIPIPHALLLDLPPSRLRALVFVWFVWNIWLQQQRRATFFLDNENKSCTNL